MPAVESDHMLPRPAPKITSDWYHGDRMVNLRMDRIAVREGAEPSLILRFG